eukprot:SAG31_NODE_12790_length_916_cov_4.436965_3_plen_26_part_01
MNTTLTCLPPLFKNKEEEQRGGGGGG